jgi:hypothetical protein
LNSYALSNVSIFFYFLAEILALAMILLLFASTSEETIVLALKESLTLLSLICGVDFLGI